MNRCPIVCLDSTAHSVGNNRRTLKRGMRENQDELFTAVTPCNAFSADSGFDELGYGFQYFIADLVRERIIDFFEVIEV